MLKKFYQRKQIEAGLDEAGRGCLAGPVFAAAVILDPTNRIFGLNDSKKLKAEERDQLRIKIEDKALAYSVALVPPRIIDKVNILNASFLAMHKAVQRLDVRPSLLLIDGNRFNEMYGYSHLCIIKGDAKYQSIAAASILAKTYRDEYMIHQHTNFPNYNWDTNMGYPTEVHREAIIQHGITDLHRKTFQLLNYKQLSIFR